VVVAAAVMMVPFITNEALFHKHFLPRVKTWTGKSKEKLIGDAISFLNIIQNSVEPCYNDIGLYDT
jgi:hypothetical protein